jgi:hypothetical protein
VQYFSPDGFDYDQSIRKPRATRRAKLTGVISNPFAQDAAASVHLMKVKRTEIDANQGAARQRTASGFIWNARVRR